MLEIRNLRVSGGEKEIIRDFSLSVGTGEIHAIMGPNGSGKSTLSQAIVGSPKFAVTAGDILLNGESILDWKPEERAQAGIFIGWQHPKELEGVRVLTFLKASYDALQKKRNPDYKSELTIHFRKRMQAIMEKLGIEDVFLNRYVNVGFSGGEKKKLEMLQLVVLDPQIAILDEIDSGLDIDALKVISAGINEYMSAEKSIVLITHYDRLLQLVKPDYVHVMRDGAIVHSGDISIAKVLEAEGYDYYHKK